MGIIRNPGPRPQRFIPACRVRRAALSPAFCRHPAVVGGLVGAGPQGRHVNVNVVAHAQQLEVQERKGRGAGETSKGAETVAPVPLPTSDESDALLRLRHSCAHIMAMAVQRLHKNAQVTIGPWIDRGFYYDFDIPEQLSDKDLTAIKKEMRRIW